MSSSPAPVPDNESARLGVLRDLEILDTVPEQVYDDLALLAANICGTPIALVSLVDADRQWFKAKLGLSASETHRDLAFCSHAILQPDEVFNVPDALADSRFATNELVTGGPRIRAYSGAPIVMESGAVLGTVCVIDTLPRVFTAAQNAALQALARQATSQLELRSFNLNLEATVAARTHDLNEALVAAEAAGRAKSAFVSAMSHEIRTPMNGVVGMIDVLAQSELRRSQAEIVSMVRDSAHALLRIVDDVLDFSKIEAGSFSIGHDPVSLERVAIQACDTLSMLAESKGVTLDVEVDALLPAWVLGDALRVRQVLLNLIGNAVKFSSGEGRAGIVDVRVQLKDRTAQGCGVDMIVSDNGIGMDAATQARLFSPFTQADAGTTKRFGGTGLGLSISHRLAGLMGGSISVDSEPGQGSRFVLHLQFEVVDAASAPAAASSHVGRERGADRTAGPANPPRPESSADAGRRLILVAEDNEMNQQVISRQLAILGYSADIAESGQVALEKFAQGGHALLLTDLHMPVMDGFELATTIRASEPAGQRLTIVALTADASLAASARCRDVGMDDCVTKPLPLGTLQALLRKWLPADMQPLPLARPS